MDNIAQLSGVDRRFFHRRTGESYTVEYKTGFDAHLKGAFIETISNDRFDRPGWVYTCSADHLLYFVPEAGRLLVVRPQRLREEIDGWLRKFGDVEVWTGSKGLRLPIDELARSADRDYLSPKLKVDDFSDLMEPPPPTRVEWIQVDN